MGSAGGNHQGAAGAGLLDYIIDEVAMIQRLGDYILKYISHSASCNVVRNTVIALIIAWRGGRVNVRCNTSAKIHPSRHSMPVAIATVNEVGSRKAEVGNGM